MSGSALWSCPDQLGIKQIRALAGGDTGHNCLGLLHTATHEVLIVVGTQIGVVFERYDLKVIVIELRHPENGEKYPTGGVDAHF